VVKFSVTSFNVDDKNFAGVKTRRLLVRSKLETTNISQGTPDNSNAVSTQSYLRLTMQKKHGFSVWTVVQFFIAPLKAGMLYFGRLNQVSEEAQKNGNSCPAIIEKQKRNKN
jgi:hypothetical protein